MKRKRVGETEGLEEPQASSTPPARPNRRTKTSIPRGAPVIDLTAEPTSPKPTPKKRKRKSTYSSTLDQEEDERRLRPYRNHPPQTYLVKFQRARTQRLFVLGRKRIGTENDPEEHVDIAGTTGNIYQVVIGRVPTCTCPDNKKGNQCKHIVYVLYNVLKVQEPLRYQLAFITSELREIFAAAPLSPVENASTSNEKGNRKDVDGECPICFMPFEPESEEIVWCKAACGNNIHKACFDQWRTSQQGNEVRCVYCRTPWQNDVPTTEDLLAEGMDFKEGYLNIGSRLGLSGVRDDSTYHRSWSRYDRYDRYDRYGRYDDDDGDYDDD